MTGPDVVDCPSCDYQVDATEDGDSALSDVVHHMASAHGVYDTDEALRAIHGLPHPVADVTGNREAWLQRASEAMDPWLAEIEGVEVCPVRVSIGWPSSGGLGQKRRVVGECWRRRAAADGVNQIFISPVRGDVDTVEILSTLLHEKIHAVDDCQSGHKKDFIRIARALGFTAKWTSTPCGEELRERLEGLHERLGPIPSAAILAGGGDERTGEKPQKNRQLKTMCPNTGYIARTTAKWLEEFGAPICPCCRAEMQIEEKEND